MNPALPLTLPIPTLLQRLQRGLSTVEFVYLPHDRWPLRRSPDAHYGHHLQISILDSSFNPPTLAHLALINSPLPPPSKGDRPPPNDYDAKLLLLSIRNVDKSLKPNDAKLHQRLEMVVLLARDVVGHDHNGAPTADANVAVAAIDEPRFVDKSSLLLTYLRQRLNSMPDLSSANLSASNTPLPPIPRLTFLQGLDTLGRLFSPRYYETEEGMIQELRNFFSDDGDGSRVVCARRVQHSTNVQEKRLDDEQILEQAEREAQSVVPIREYIDSGRITLIDIAKDERTFSSTELREKANRGDDSWMKLTTTHIADYILAQNLYISDST